MVVTDIAEDFKDGLALINLLEILAEEESSPNKLGKYYKEPKGIVQMAENCQFVVDFMALEGIKLTNIGNEDIREGNVKLTAAVLFSLIEHYLFGTSYLEEKNKLLKWVQEKIPDFNITNFTAKQWSDGKAVNAVIQAIAPSLVPPNGDPMTNWKQAINVALADMKIPALLDAEDLSDPQCDEKTMVTYLSYFPKARADRANTTCEFPKSGFAMVPFQFNIKTPAADSGEVSVSFKLNGGEEVDVPSGVIVAMSKSNALQDNGDGSLVGSMYPQEGGEVSVAVSLDGREVPGSRFTVPIGKKLAHQVRTEGPGLSNPIAWTPTEFQVVIPELTDEVSGLAVPHGKVTVEVMGAKAKAKSIALTKCEGGVNFVTFTPAEPGAHKVTVKLDDEEVSGSPFTVDVGTPPTLFTGWVHKKARGEHFYTVIKGWKHRFFVVLPDGSVTYFEQTLKAKQIKDLTESNHKAEKGQLNVVTSKKVELKQTGENFKDGLPLQLVCDGKAVQMSFATQGELEKFIKGVCDLNHDAIVS